MKKFVVVLLTAATLVLTGCGTIGSAISGAGQDVGKVGEYIKNIEGIIMSGVYMEELEYDIQELFIIGYEPNEIAEQLDVSVGKIIEVLNAFGVKSEDWS